MKNAKKRNLNKKFMKNLLKIAHQIKNFGLDI